MVWIRGEPVYMAVLDDTTVDTRAMSIIGGRCCQCGHSHNQNDPCVIGSVPKVEFFRTSNTQEANVQPSEPSTADTASIVQPPVTRKLGGRRKSAK